MPLSADKGVAIKQALLEGFVDIAKGKNYTPNEWRTNQNTLETSGFLGLLNWRASFSENILFQILQSHLYDNEIEVTKLHSKRVEKMQNYTRDEWKRCKTTLETSGEDVKSHSKRVEKISIV